MHTAPFPPVHPEHRFADEESYLNTRRFVSPQPSAGSYLQSGRRVKLIHPSSVFLFMAEVIIRKGVGCHNDKAVYARPIVKLDSPTVHPPSPEPSGCSSGLSAVHVRLPSNAFFSHELPGMEREPAFFVFSVVPWGGTRRNPVIAGGRRNFRLRAATSNPGLASKDILGAS
jgi:hypothetical protein